MKTVKYIGNLFLTVFLTMTVIYIIKMVSQKYNIPVIKTISEGV